MIYILTLFRRQNLVKLGQRKIKNHQKLNYDCLFSKTINLLCLIIKSSLKKVKNHLIFLKNSFTLVELLIVVALVGILATVVVLVLNPSEFLRQARDSKRLNDLTILNRAINMYIADSGGGGFYGSSSVVYVSIPDTSPTCSNLGLPTLPSGWSYHCAPSSTLQNIDGSGWIPINFNLQTFGRSITRLPIDPINQTSTLNYYTYVTGGSFKLTSRFESEKYVLAHTAKDGGPDPALYETGSDPQLAPFVGGLVGWWPFDEGSGTIAYDRSGYENHGTMYSSSTITDLHTSAGCKSGSCASFDGVDDYVDIGNPSSLQITKDLTILMFIYPTNISKSRQNPLGKAYGGEYMFTMETNGYMSFYQGSCGGNCAPYGYIYNSPFSLFNNNWYQIGVRRIIYLQKMDLIKNGFKLSGGNYLWLSPSTSSLSVLIGKNYAGNYQGLIDEIRIYNRALSDSEIQAIYNAIK